MDIGKYGGSGTSSKLPRFTKAVKALRRTASESVVSLAVLFKLLIIFAFCVSPQATALEIANAALALYEERLSKKLAI